ncbi:nitrate reductase gamma subunit [Desulfitobacterium dichloroeliminans LMG P-21439]|uniref:Nitrate reductase gamma subunit n=1 Tax=Desulfitobacterium dichloroeliminans (strain LMG P-21439 / DCA1) TaxID=871963 RepID=L0F3M9_DESDL|nr:respiratory nitrate reductase subunit gamma [Desulfitobacterium dichloroeliminans]AGA67787.1 nitrate reductase gamma subunit [Desulfitobacterium dichloroeliminans LMG P-21439]
MFLVFYAILAMVLFLGISVYKAYVYTKMPMHGRLDLYPVPKEKGHAHGGSYYEQQEWWKRPRETSLASEIIDMLKEILFIKKLFENQRSLWWLSYSLHLGIYLIIAWTVLLVVGAVTELAGGTVATSGSAWGMLIYYLTPLVGWAGFALATFGALTLVFRRQMDSTLKKYTTPQEYFNLLLLFAVTATGILVWGGDLSMSSAREAMANVLTLQPLNASSLMVVHIVLAGFMLVYIPLSKMSHYVGKFFSFHMVNWENDPNLPGSKIEEKIKANAQNSPKTKWAAPHISGQVAAPAEKTSAQG